jgi:hypothetical protein
MNRKNQSRPRLRAALVLLIALFTVTASWASEEKTMCVVIHEVHGTTAFALEARPIVSFLDNDVQLQCGELTVLYPLDQYLKLTIEESAVPTDIQGRPGNESFTISGSAVTARGVSRLVLYSVDGKRIATAKPGDDGAVTLSTAQLRAGVYVLSCGTKSFKISIKK